MNNLNAGARSRETRVEAVGEMRRKPKQSCLVSMAGMMGLYIVVCWRRWTRVWLLGLDGEWSNCQTFYLMSMH